MIAIFYRCFNNFSHKFLFGCCRRMSINSFISGFHTEDILNTLHVLLMYIQSAPPEEKVMVAVLLLHFDLMVCFSLSHTSMDFLLFACQFSASTISTFRD